MMSLHFRQMDMVESYGYRATRQWIGKSADGSCAVCVLEWNIETASALHEAFSIVGATGYNFVDRDIYAQLHKAISSNGGLDSLDGSTISFSASRIFAFGGMMRKKALLSLAGYICVLASFSLFIRYNFVFWLMNPQLTQMQIILETWKISVVATILGVLGLLIVSVAKALEV